MAGIRHLVIPSLIINILVLYFTFTLVRNKFASYSIIYTKDCLERLHLKDEIKYTHQTQEIQIQNKENDRILNITNFQFILNTPPQICEKNEENKTVVIATIFIPPFGFRERQAIRNTWGSVKQYKTFVFHPIFLIGEENASMSEKFMLHKELAEENDLYKDIVMGNFIDTYKNLTYKRLMGSKWIVDHCKTAKYILKIDDEWFADTFRVLDFIEQMIPHLELKPNSHFACDLYIRDSPIRNNKTYLKVDMKDYARSTFPDYCVGPASISTRSALEREYSVRHKIPFFWAEDIFHTGLLREYYELVNNEEITLWPLGNGHHNVMANPGFERDWCSHPQKEKYMGSLPFQWIFIEMNRGPEFVSDITCLWKKTIEVKVNSLEQEKNKYL